MLVLSRRPDEKILLPSVPAAIKVISAQAGLVRLGIEAPSHIPILREELCRPGRARSLPAACAGPEDPAAESDSRHAVRNRLNNLILGLALLRMQLPDADPAVRQTLDGIEDELTALIRVVTAAAGDEVSDVGTGLAAPAG